jgi:23S rRNA pseudouridine1911/1915/1917 synthase
MKSSDNASSPDVVFCDNHLLIAFKPAGWLTQPDESKRADLESFAKEWVKREFQKPGAVFLHCIHRLDRPVSGLVLFAKTSKALTRLNEISRGNQIRRWYLAEVVGILPQKSGRLEHFLVHGEHQAIVSTPENPEAKKALLTYQVVDFKEHSTLVQIELQTGRYHQIRAQFSAIGYPIVGDARYNGKGGSVDEIRLSCTDLKFPHPVTREEISFHSEAPFA